MILVYLVDTVWTAIAAIGLGVSVWTLIDGYFDRRALRAPDVVPSRPRDVIVTINLRTAKASLLLHGFFLLLGGLALSRPSAVVVTPTYVVLVTGYILVAATNARAVTLNQLDRVRLRRMAS